MKNLIKCDKCGKIEQLSIIEEGEEIRILKANWASIEGNDFCPDCYEEFKKLLEEFKKGGDLY